MAARYRSRNSGVGFRLQSRHAPFRGSTTMVASDGGIDAGLAHVGGGWQASEHVSGQGRVVVKK